MTQVSFAVIGDLRLQLTHSAQNNFKLEVQKFEGGAWSTKHTINPSATTGCKLLINASTKKLNCTDQAVDVSNSSIVVRYAVDFPGTAPGSYVPDFTFRKGIPGIPANTDYFIIGEGDVTNGIPPPHPAVFNFNITNTSDNGPVYVEVKLEVVSSSEGLVHVKISGGNQNNVQCHAQADYAHACFI